MIYKTVNDKLQFNVSANKVNYGQRNNEFRWQHPLNSKLAMDGLSMCNVTSIVMALDYIGYKFPSGRFNQPEDNLCEFIFTSKEVDAYYEKTMPVLWKAYNRGDTNAYCPNLIHIVLAYSTNLWLQTNCVTFYESMLITEILKEIIHNNRPVVMSGTFPYNFANGSKGTLGHINTLVGIEYNKNKIPIISSTEILKITPDNLIFDDPFGNYRQNFASGSGNDVITPYADFIKYYKTLNDTRAKMAHIFEPAVALI